MVENKKRLLFVCVENANRSQMAAAFARMYGGEGIEVHSAGSHPAGRINPKAIAAMREVGYDLTQHRPSGLNEIPKVTYDCVVTMGCGDACPQVDAELREDWQIPDPRDMGEDEFREVRDLIAAKVKNLLETL